MRGKGWQMVTEKGWLQVGFVPHWNCSLGFQDFAD